MVHHLARLVPVCALLQVLLVQDVLVLLIYGIIDRGSIRILILLMRDVVLVA